MLTMIDLFSGAGGFSLAADWTGGIIIILFCEIDSYCQELLNKNFPGIPIIKTIKELKNDGQYGAIDIITGGFPCQPFSVAGRQKGTEDDRDLWPEMFRVIKEFKPTWVIGENVAAFVNMAFTRTKIDLESEGYEVQPLDIPACGVGANHKRARVWILAYSRHNARINNEISRNNKQTSKYSQKRENSARQFKRSSGRERGFEILADSKGEQSNGLCREADKELHRGNSWMDIKCSSNRQSVKKTIQTMANTNKFNDDKPGFRASKLSQFKASETQPMQNWESEPGMGRVADGIPHRVDRLKCLGNAIVPQVVYPILKGIVDIENKLAKQGA